MRRVLIVACAATLLAALWVTAPALSLAPYVPRARDFTQALPQAGSGPLLRASATARAAGHGRVFRAPGRFDLVGLRWSGEAEVRVLLRVRRDGGRWSRWVEAPGAGDHGPDRGRALGGTDPVWTGGSDLLQVRLSRPVPGLRAHFVNVTGSTSPADRLRTAMRRAAHSAVARVAPSIAGAAATQPAIVSRAAWGGDQCQPRSAPGYGTVKMAFVHHTVNANGYAPEDSASIVLGICRYHRNSNGWDDIGYNFLVDRYGQVFEGRAGGIDRAVRGAHAQGFNSESTGIANLGTFTSESQTEPGVRALSNLLAWKLSLHGVPVTGRASVTSAGGSASRYPAGRTVSLERISGHRDGGVTSCPGDQLYAQLPRLRALAAGQAGQADGLLAAVDSSRVVYPEPVRLSGRLAFPEGPAPPGAPIEVERRTGSGYETATTALVGQDGTWISELAADRSGAFRARYRGDDTHPPATSRAIGVSVVPALTARAAARRIVVGGRVLVTGTIAPAKPALSVSVERWDRWRYRFIGSQPVTVTRGRYRVRVKLGRRTAYRLRVRFATDRLNASVRSQPLIVVTQRPSGGLTAR